MEESRGNAGMCFCCSYCSFRSNKWRIFIRHTFECHSSLPNFSIECPVTFCRQIFKNFSTFNSHFTRKHSGYVVDNNLADSSSIVHVDINNDDVYECGNQEIDMELEASTGVASKDMAQRSAALFLLTMKEKFCLTQVALDFAVGQVRQMVGYLMEDIKSKLTEELKADTNFECFEWKDPFMDLDTEYLQHKFYKKHFGLIVSLT